MSSICTWNIRFSARFASKTFTYSKFFLIDYSFSSSPELRTKKKRCLFQILSLSKRLWCWLSRLIKTNESWSLISWSSEAILSNTWIWSSPNFWNQSSRYSSPFQASKSRSHRSRIWLRMSVEIYQWWEMISNRRCVRTKKNSKHYELWIYTSWSQLIDSIWFISWMRASFSLNWVPWKNG